MTRAAVSADRDQVLAFRRTTGHLDARLPRSTRSLREIGWSGLQDSMPRAAVLSVNARMESTEPGAWAYPAFAQVWGPRYSVFVVPIEDRGAFTLGRLPEGQKARARAYDTATAIREVLAGGSLPFGEVGKALGRNPNSLRYAATTGTVLLRWDGARQPTIWTVEPPDIDPEEARRELAHRFLHVYGPSTPESFAAWAGITSKTAASTFDAVRRSLTPVTTPLGGAWLLTRDVETLHAGAPQPTVRLLPSGDSYYLMWGPERDLLVPNARHRGELWTSRVWPGAILADGEIVGTWRRSKNVVTVAPWTRLSRRLRQEISSEAASLPLPPDSGAVEVRFDA